MTARIGARELRQNLSAVLKRVERGERLIITSRNRPVAEIGPLHNRPRRTLAALIDAGLATPPRQRGPLPRPLKLDLGDPNALSKALEELRDEERR